MKGKEAEKRQKKITQTAGRNAPDEFAPEFTPYNGDVLFGENGNNQDIDVKTRSVITVVALMVSGITDSSLKYHLNGVNRLQRKHTQNYAEIEKKEKNHE